jgi:ketosteroid isomerase-like protein
VKRRPCTPQAAGQHGFLVLAVNSSNPQEFFTMTAMPTNVIQRIVDIEIRAAVDRFMIIFQRGDPKEIAATYSKNPVVAAPFGDVVRGQAELLVFWQSVLGGPGMVLQSYEVLDVQALGDGFAAETTRFVATIGGQRTEGKYLVIWKREDEQWKLHLDAFNVAP